MRLSALLLAVLCWPLAAPAAPADEGKRLARYMTRMLDRYWQLNPESAFAVGCYKYADRISVYDAAARDTQRAFDEQNLQALAGFDPERLSVAQRLDVAIMRNQFESDRWYLDTFRAWQWQPSQYNVADTFALQLPDHDIQTGSMTREQIMDLLVREAFQSEAEASDKWRRATLTQVQLTSYYDGYAEIVALREEQQARLGAKFNLKAFHNRFLSYGNVPVRTIRELMDAPVKAPR